MRPRIVGEALQRITRDPQAASTLFDILETQKIIDGEARITMVPAGDAPFAQWLIANRRSGSGPEK
jgi:hypothetical protein